MLHIFRRIRKALITDSKYRKYILYGVGEIALVMIGILLALQVNTWNDMRVQHEEEVIALYDLKNEFESNLDEVEELIDFKSTKVKEWETYLSIISDKTKPRKERSIVRPVMGSYLFSISNPAVNSVLTTGKIDRIQNDSLKQMLTEWRDLLEQERGPEQLQADFVNKTFLPIELKLLPNQTLMEITSTKNAFFTDKEAENMRLNAIQDMEYLNCLVHNLHLLKIQVFAGQNLKALHEKVIVLLDEELETRK